MKRKIAGTIADATLPKTPIELGGVTYNLCFDLGALCEAETAINDELRASGQAVNLLIALPVQNLANTRLAFAAAVRVFHPELTFEAACDVLRLADMLLVAIKVKEAWEASRPEAAESPDPLAATA